MIDRWFPQISLSLELSVDENPWKIEEIPNDRGSKPISRAEKY